MHHLTLAPHMKHLHGQHESHSMRLLRVSLPFKFKEYNIYILEQKQEGH